MFSCSSRLFLTPYAHLLHFSRQDSAHHGHLLPFRYSISILTDIDCAVVHWEQYVNAELQSSSVSAGLEGLAILKVLGLLRHEHFELLVFFWLLAKLWDVKTTFCVVNDHNGDCSLVSSCAFCKNDTRVFGFRFGNSRFDNLRIWFSRGQTWSRLLESRCPSKPGGHVRTGAMSLISSGQSHADLLCK